MTKLKKVKAIKAWAVVYAKDNTLCLHKDGAAAIWDWSITKALDFKKELQSHLTPRIKVIPVKITPLK